MKAALVTGAAKRLGRDMALRLGRLGYFVHVHYRASQKEAKEVARLIEDAGGSAAIVGGDIARQADIDFMVDEIERTSGRIDLLVNNVGLYKTGQLLEYPTADFDVTLQTNLVGPYHLITKSLRLFPSEGGSIINIGYAGLENLTSSTYNTAYLVSKTGLYILTKSHAEALGPRNIRVNMISPGVLSNSVELPDRPKDYIPLGHLGECSHVCDALEFLIGDGAAYITGINLDVAGGYMMGLRSLDR